MALWRTSVNTHMPVKLEDMQKIYENGIAVVRVGAIADMIQELEPDAVVIEDGFTVNERNVPDAAEDVTEWLNSLKF